LGFMAVRHLAGAGSGVAARAPPAAVHPFATAACPQCGAARLVKIEGCHNCLDCGYSKCG
jgi:ribonucleoside-diphosphate reductase alpha chain